MDTASQSQPFEVKIHLPVRTYDIDFAGVVNNIVYVRWLEDLRLEMLARHFPLDEQLKNGIAPVIVQTKIDYKQSIKISDYPHGKMWIKKMELLRWTINAEIVVDDKIAAFGEQVGIFVDLQNNKPIRIPKKLKQKYHEFVA
jgi:acyl-CoA thioester hydrolase